MLICLPPIKVAYDSLIVEYSSLFPNDFTEAFFVMLPYLLLGLIVFGTIYKLFRRDNSGEL